MSRNSSKTIEQVVAEFMLASESGNAPDRSEFLGRYPQFAAELEEFFGLHERLSSTGATEPAKSASPAVAASAAATSRPYDTPTLLWNAAGSSSSNPPRFLGDYEILEEIDRGGMGIVFKARHQKLNRLVALKLIRSGELASQEEVQRFLSEAEAAAALTHPGIVPIYEIGTFNGLVFYTMAYIEGCSLAALVPEGGMDPGEALRITHKLCAAVEFAHRAGIYHRDLKPANVLINEAGQPVIIDFGLAKIVHHDEGLTATGQLLGTPAYMTPEHASGKAKNVGPAADVYALGAILYFLCTGQPAFSGPTPFDILLQVLDRRPPLPSKLNKKLSRDIDQVCLRMLEKDPALRYCSAGELARDLQRILTGEPIEVPEETLPRRLVHWWQREPILVAHVTAIGLTTAIISLAHLTAGQPSLSFNYRLGLLVSWLGASLILQYGVHRVRWRSVAIISWLVVDVVIFTTLIAFARPPRSMLLIGYPMMVVASALFYQRRYTVITTLLCILGFLLLSWRFPQDDFVRVDFDAIFLSGLTVICLCMLAMMHRIRGLSRFYDE